MPGSRIRTFTDPDDYAASIRNRTTQVTVTESGAFSAQYTGIDLDNVWMQRAVDNLARISHGVAPAGRISVLFRTRPGRTLMWRGREMESTSLVVQGPFTDYYIRSSGSASLGAVSLPADEIASLGPAVAGQDPTLERNASMRACLPSALAVLRRVHAAAARVAMESPDTITHPEAARSLEQLVIGSVIDCLFNGELLEDNAAARRHHAIMRRFHEVLEANSDRGLHLPELCVMVGATERTLRRCCHEQFGFGPKQFLLLRRLQLARRALRNSGMDTTTVTSIAARYGFWDFGRFAGAYKSLFGEAPSLTLRHSA
jgi:AraC-like DNA-binding protein